MALFNWLSWSVSHNHLSLKIVTVPLMPCSRECFGGGCCSRHFIKAARPGSDRGSVRLVFASRRFDLRTGKGFFLSLFFYPPHFFSRHGTAAVAIFRLPWGRIPQLPTREPEASRIKTPAQTATDRVQLTECCQPSCLACRAHHPLPCRGKIGRAFLYCWSCATKFLPFLTPCLFVPVGWWGLAVLISSTYLLFFYLLASCLLINRGFF